MINLAFCIFLAALTAEATALDSVVLQNRECRSQWVNWGNDGWVGGELVQTVAGQIRQEAESREAIPLQVHDWICSNIYFDMDAANAGSYDTLSAEEVLRERRGVCEGISNLTQSLMTELDIPCIKVWGVATEPGTVWTDEMLETHLSNHTWNEFYWGGRWLSMDCSMDIGSVYQNGEYIRQPAKSDFFAPVETVFAETHRCIRRGNTSPADTPSFWAMDEVQRAVDSGLIPVSLLSHYREPITEDGFRRLLGLDGGSTDPVSRLEAALQVSALCTDETDVLLPYRDISQMKEPVQQALACLYQAGIMTGTHTERFSPDRPLTREEAICIKIRLTGG